MRVPAVAVFTVGYVLGSRAGRERYAQMLAVAATASERLEQFSARPRPAPRSDGGGAGAARDA